MYVQVCAVIYYAFTDLDAVATVDEEENRQIRLATFRGKTECCDVNIEPFPFIHRQCCEIGVASWWTTFPARWKG